MEAHPSSRLQPHVMISGLCEARDGFHEARGQPLCAIDDVRALADFAHPGMRVDRFSAGFEHTHALAELGLA